MAHKRSEIVPDRARLKLGGERGPVSNYGVPKKGWKSELKLSECQDYPTLIAALMPVPIPGMREMTPWAALASFSIIAP